MAYELFTSFWVLGRFSAIDLEKQRYHSISFSLIENTKWQLPLVIGSRHEKGIELMNRLLFPFRSSTDLERTTPSQSKWNFGMTSFNDSFARVSFRIYNREDENLNQVLPGGSVLFSSLTFRYWSFSWTMWKSNLVGLGPIRSSIGFQLNSALANIRRILITFGWLIRTMSGPNMVQIRSPWKNEIKFESSLGNIKPTTLLFPT